MRHFHQPIEYWLDHCTLRDWREIYQRELIEAPPAEQFLASYFDYSPPTIGGEDPDDEEEVVFDVSDCEV